VAIGCTPYGRRPFGAAMPVGVRSRIDVCRASVTTERQPAFAEAADDKTSREAAAIEERLWAIVQAVGGCHVESHGDDLWFGLESGSDLQVRLSGNREARCYDTSANFGISHGGQPSDASLSRFRAAVERIKTIDTAPLAGLAAAFRPAARALVRSLSKSDANEPPACPEPVPAAPLGSETPRRRALNVIFLDLCARLAGRPEEALLPLHWGFWPTDAAASGHTPEGYDPQQAYSEELLAHVPASVTRILDVGCGLGFNARILSARGKQVTAVSPVPHHCAVLEGVRLPGVEVRCTRFEDMSPDEPYDLLLFSESVNHFMLTDEFMLHCGRFLTESGYMLMADDLSAENVHNIEEQQQFRVLGAWDITHNVAPTTGWFARQLPALAAYHRAMMAILELYEPPLAARVGTILDSLENRELKALFTGSATPPASKGRYMIFLLQRAMVGPR
jgi:SAM-dependent methyltransferase